MLYPSPKLQIDIRRSVSPLTLLAGLAAVTLGITDSPVSAFSGVNGWGFGMVLLAASAPITGAAAFGHDFHRDSGPAPAMRPPLAKGMATGLLLVGLFGLAVAIRPEVPGVPGLESAESGIILAGLVLAISGAFLWNRRPARRRFAIMGALGSLLLIGWVVLAAGGAWEAAAHDGSFSAFSAANFGLLVSGHL